MTFLVADMSAVDWETGDSLWDRLIGRGIGLDDRHPIKRYRAHRLGPNALPMRHPNRCHHG